ncbi:DUF3137 domain-containing protein [Sulfurimonas sp.]|uniref:DUF3137 domain-containing protein n=1 Tax=Sulfurimonas sp. TaxID=2022749 RepID=UPI00356B42FA
MKSKSELTDFYYKALYPILQDLEKDRKILRSRIISVGTIYTIVFALLIYTVYGSIKDEDVLTWGIFLYVAIGGFIYKFMIKDYTSEFKEKIISPLIDSLEEKLTYHKDLHISEHLFVRSKLFSSPDRTSGNDLVKGEIKNTKIRFSDFHAEKRHRNSKGRDSWSTIFRGLFVVAEFNKNFIGETVVLPDTAQKTFGDLIGNWLQSKNLGRDELVKMDDPEFEKRFVVYSDDQIEARYILSNSIMKKLTTFEKRFGHPLYISFVRNHIHLAVYYNKDMFEPSIFSSLLEYKTAMEYVDTLHLATGIIEELKLNERIWSKV